MGIPAAAAPLEAQQAGSSELLKRFAGMLGLSTTDSKPFKDDGMVNSNLGRSNSLGQILGLMGALNGASQPTMPQAPSAGGTVQSTGHGRIQNYMDYLKGGY